jgi:preprotein translocase subunit SecG
VSLFLTVLHVMVCLVLIVVVLLQRGKGAEIGAVFGGGASSTVFGSRGAGNFLTKLTTGSAVVFMVTSLWLSALGTSSFSRGLFGGEQPAAPAESPFAEPKTDGAPSAAPETPTQGAGGFAEPKADGAAPATAGAEAKPEQKPQATPSAPAPPSGKD